MQLTAYEIALIGGGFTVVGTILGAILTFRFSLKLSDINSKRIAAIRLRDAFAPEVARIRLLTDATRYETPKILNVAFEKHLMAANEFEFFLTQKERVAFANAWKEYISRNNEKEDRFDKYFISPEAAIEAIYDILKFTKH